MFVCVFIYSNVPVSKSKNSLMYFFLTSKSAFPSPEVGPFCARPKRSYYTGSDVVSGAEGECHGGEERKERRNQLLIGRWS